ncbi:MAG: hypothetical protein GY719_05800 [bacterium]|nr:hypothetical protein [bacterium]
MDDDPEEVGGQVDADTVGSVTPTPPDTNSDSAEPIRTEGKFLNSALTTEFGTWSSFSGNTRVRIEWDSGVEEWWKLTWRDETLNKLEAYFRNDAGNWRDFYLQNPATEPPQYSPYYFRRNEDARNVGFALGAHESFDDNAEPTSAFDGFYRGLVRRTENYTPGGREQNGPWTVNLGGGGADDFKLTSEGVWRLFVGQPCYAGDPVARDCLSYLDVPDAGSSGLKSRRVYMQVDHDWTPNGYISDEKGGHTYHGFQIADSNDDVRGFVFAEASYSVNPGDHEFMMMSALFLLDDTSDAAQTGIAVDPLWVPGIAAED